MSKAGMWGLLEGVGDGVKMVGDGMVKNALLEAQEKRQMNLLNIQRQWGKEDKLDERAYQDKKFEEREVSRLAEKGQDRAIAKEDKLEDRAYADVTEETRHTRNRAETEADQVTSFNNQMKVAQFGVDNREPSSEDKKQKVLKSMLDNGEITQEEYKNNILGLSKSAGFTQKDLAGAWEGAYKQAAKERESDMKFQGLPAEEQKKALDSRAGELVQRFVGSSVGGASKGLLENPGIELHPKKIMDIATKIAGASPEQVPAALQSLKDKGVSDDQINRVQAQVVAIQAKKEAVSEGGQPTATATAGPPTDQNWQQNLSGKSPISNMLTRGQNMTPEERQAAKEKREGNLRGSFGGQRPY